MDPAGQRTLPSPADIERQLAEFWRKASTDEQAVMRACSMNLVVVCTADAGDVARATACVARIAETIPGRSIVIGPPRDRGTDFEAYVSTNCHHGPAGAQVCSEQVTIDPTAHGLDLVPGTVLQLLVEDMPVYTWWRGGSLGEGGLLDPLVGLSDYWVLDSALAAHGREQLEALERIASRPAWCGRILDGAWIRLEPWREVIASFFDDPSLRPALGGIERLSVSSGGPVAFAYLAGWLVSRLGLRHSGGGRWSRPDGALVELTDSRAEGLAAGRVAAVRIEAAHRDTAVVFEAGTAPGRPDRVSLSVTAEGHRLPPRTIDLPWLDETGLVCGLLQRTGRDAVFDDALRQAVRLIRA